MGLRGSIKLIRRPPLAQVQYKAVQDEIKKQLATVARAHLAERKRIVDNFEHKPEFDTKISVTDKQVTLTVDVKNANEKVGRDWTIGDLWAALDAEGTRAHIIQPRKPGGKLRFNWGGPGSYKPKTYPIARSGGPGMVQGGQVVYAKKVKHPGTKPRKFSETIHKRLQRQYDQAIDRGVRQGLANANKR